MSNPSPDMNFDEDLRDLPPAERAVQLLLRPRGIEIESLRGEARAFADLRIADAEIAVAALPEAGRAAEADRIAPAVADELAELLHNHAHPLEDDDA